MRCVRAVRLELTLFAYQLPKLAGSPLPYTLTQRTRMVGPRGFDPLVSHPTYFTTSVLQTGVGKGTHRRSWNRTNAPSSSGPTTRPLRDILDAEAGVEPARRVSETRILPLDDSAVLVPHTGTDPVFLP